MLFTGRFLDKTWVPAFRPPGQIWVFKEVETPVHNTLQNVNLDAYAGLFNVSMTYSSQSDVTIPYGKCTLKTSSSLQDANVETVTANKTELVAWIASNCIPRSQRQKYVSELQKYIPVHTYGKCGHRSCFSHKKDMCNRLLREKYKFYLAFENALCDEYLTEKFWKCLELNVVPVVYGLATYDRFAPEHSFIDVRDFASPKDLADYLWLLHNNDTLYREYFEWKKTHDCHNQGMEAMPCSLCRVLHEKKQAKRTLGPIDITKAWGSNTDTQCMDVETFRDSCNCWPRSNM